MAEAGGTVSAWITVATLVAVGGAWSAPPVAAQTPRASAGSPTSTGAAPGPGVASRPVQTAACSATWLDPEHPRAPTAHLRQLGMDTAWTLSAGSGQVIAVIDTGVAPHPRLPRLRGAGDLVADSDGLSDCDAHGTLVAGLAAAARGPDGFSGIAPDAEIVAVRQSSAAFEAAAAPGQPPDRHAAAHVPGSGSLRTLAVAVRRAADAGATVINISEVACVPRGTALADEELSEALRYAVLERDIVVVGAAGNIDGPCRDGNPTLADPRDPSGDGHVRTVAAPAWYDDLVLTVGAVDERGVPAEFSLPGPWVDVAAPGVGLTSLSVTGPGSVGPVPDLGTAVVDERGQLSRLDGTSFAAPLVAGLAALVRARFPDLTARQVIDRIIATALGGAAAGGSVPGGSDHRVGAGIVDPVAALTSPGQPRPRAVASPAPLTVRAQPMPDPTPWRHAGLLGGVAAGLAALVLAGLGWSRALGDAARGDGDDPTSQPRAGGRSPSAE